MNKNTPLSEQMRPVSLAEISGQDHLLGKNGLITSIIESGRPLSIILWGPPGCGKTSIARLYAKAFKMRFETLSAVFSGITDIKKIINDREATPLFGYSTLLFVDEIHRFNKAQQDAFLPFLENGKIILVGATAENPSFYLNKALLSRTRVLKLNPLNDQSIEQLIRHYESVRKPLNITPAARKLIVELAQGDGRYLYNLIENFEGLNDAEPLDIESLKNILQRRAPLFDKAGDEHYNLISALHKSIRGSDPDAALYWFCRLLEGGEEPLFIARRLIRTASEDIGLADPQALSLSIAGRDSYEMLGSPEGELALAQVVVYLALAPKSNAIYTAFNEARELAARTNNQAPPSIILNAHTSLMKQMGYGAGYQYDHDYSTGFSGQNYFPDAVARQRFYTPVERGFERDMKKRLDYFMRLRKTD